MKTLNFNGQTLQAERIIKTANSVTGYIGDKIVFEMHGISDFSGYTFPEGTENDCKRIEILARLAELDTQAIRPLRAITAGVGDEKDNDRLVEIENEAQGLRLTLEKLKA